MAFYNAHPTVYSFGLQDGLVYAFAFSPEWELQVPGCYGTYKVGGVGKLSGYDQRPVLFQHSFSAMSNSMVTHYFYDPAALKTIYFAESNNPVEIFRPTTLEILRYSSTMSWLDRLYIALLFFKTPSNRVNTITDVPITKNKDAVALDETRFRTRFQGLLFDEQLRREKRSIQLIYTKNYNGAETVSHILEGSGARVVDITDVQSVRTQKCVVIEETEPFSQTGQYIARFFHCDLQKGKTDIYDTILQLGEIEKQWEVCE